jgi:hypothetical protein
MKTIQVTDKFLLTRTKQLQTQLNLRRYLREQALTEGTDYRARYLAIETAKHGTVPTEEAIKAYFDAYVGVAEDNLEYHFKSCYQA